MAASIVARLLIVLPHFFYDKSMSHILIVEDDPTMSRMYQRVFSLEGHDVTIAVDGEDALKKVQEQIPRLLLLDIMMPKLNGFQVLEKLKEREETRNIPVIMLTNLAGPQDMENALSRGAIKYLIKSELEPKQLADIIKEVLSGLPTQSTPAPAPTAIPAVPSSPPPTPTSPAIGLPAQTGSPTAGPPIAAAPPSTPPSQNDAGLPTTPSPVPIPTDGK